MNENKSFENEVDFSNAVQGKFYVGEKPVDITVHLDTIQPSCTYEIYHEKHGDYHFRLKDKIGNIVVISNSYQTRDDCIYAIEVLKQSAFASQTVEI